MNISVIIAGVMDTSARSGGSRAGSVGDTVLQVAAAFGALILIVIALRLFRSYMASR